MITEAGEKSKHAFIHAAGKLFAEHGIERVRLSEIATLAGVDACMINYYFGGRDGLVQAVIEDALSKWHRNDIQKYCEENSALLETRDGQCIFITGLVECVFSTLSNNGNEDPATSMLLQLLQHPHPLRQKIVERHIRPGMRFFSDIFRRISGNDDFETAFCWYLFLICPKYLCSACPGMIDLFHPQGAVSESFDRRLQHFTTKLLLSGLGLA
ncbi:MAG TPA: hypothetical protein DE060_03615 [Lentisphaeria bacterium]|nr:hypothetical protein [Lentisphaeria bacterium]HCG48279.1 hypothetical protein [Lentisphaeria bacterium]